MAELNFPGNQIFTQPQQEKKKLSPVVGQGGVVSTKKPVSKRLKEAFFGDDVIDNVVVPGIKNLILEGLEMVFFHTRTGRFNQSPYYYQQPSYNQPYYPQPSYQQPVQNQQTYQTQRVDYRNIILRTKEDADNVIRNLRQRVADYGSASVADLLDLIGVAGEYTDNNWGWRDGRYFGVRRISQGFLIVVPDAMPLGY